MSKLIKLKFTFIVEMHFTKTTTNLSFWKVFVGFKIGQKCGNRIHETKIMKIINLEILNSKIIRVDYDFFLFKHILTAKFSCVKRDLIAFSEQPPQIIKPHWKIDLYNVLYTVGTHGFFG